MRRKPVTRIAMTNAERARRHKERQADRGLVQFNVWLPARVVAEFKRAAELVTETPYLTIGRLTDTRTGRLKGLK
jgi:hypothetical protein